MIDSAALMAVAVVASAGADVGGPAREEDAAADFFFAFTFFSGFESARAQESIAKGKGCADIPQYLLGMQSVMCTEETHHRHWFPRGPSR